MVGRNDVLTAGHVVYDRASGGYATRIEIVPGQGGSVHPFGETAGIRAHIPYQYAASESFLYDIAVVQTRSDIGDLTGWLGLRSVSNPAAIENTVIHTAGYPFDRQGGNFMYGATDRVDFIVGNRIFYNGALDTFAGQSGSGLWLDEGGQRSVIGVHTTGGRSFNNGTALTPEIYDQVVAWIADDSDPGGGTEPGPDTLYGGPGTDIAAYQLGCGNYTIQRQTDGSLLVVNPDRFNVDRLYDIEILRFANGDVPGYLFV